MIYGLLLNAIFPLEQIDQIRSVAQESSQISTVRLMSMGRIQVRRKP